MLGWGHWRQIGQQFGQGVRRVVELVGAGENRGVPGQAEVQEVMDFPHAREADGRLRAGAPPEREIQSNSPMGTTRGTEIQMGALVLQILMIQTS